LLGDVIEGSGSATLPQLLFLSAQRRRLKMFTKQRLVRIISKSFTKVTTEFVKKNYGEEVPMVPVPTQMNQDKKFNAELTFLAP
jgi:hypothetical protein